MDGIEGLFFGVVTTLYTGWDPNKDPFIPNGLGLDHQDLAISSIENLLSYCLDQIKAPVELFRTLQSWLKKAELIRPTLLGAGPQGKNISEEIKRTKSALDGIVAGLKGKLSVLSTSLTSTIISLDPRSKSYDVLMGRTTDRQDSVSTKVGRLVSLQNKLERRLAALTQKEPSG